MDTNIYKPCLYIESTGTQYIDTGFKPNNNTRVVLDAQMLSSNTAQYPYGTRTSTYTVNFGVLITGGAYRSDYGESKVKLSALTDLYQRYIFDHNKNVCTIGTVSVINTVSTFQTSLNLYLCAVNQGGVASYFGKMKIYSCQIYDNDILVRDYRPVMRNDGVCGLYDSVNNVFNSSQADNFVAGFKSNYKKCFRRRLLTGKKTDDFDLANYMTMTALEDSFQASFSQEGLSYTLDGSTWVPLTANTNTPAINAGQKIAFKGSKTADNNGMGRFTTSHKCNLSGNCMSLTHEDSAADAYTCHAYQFRYLFNGCKIVEVSSDFLPATILADYCYVSMFGNCTLLTTTPTLPATILANYCYYSMFYNCTSLTTTPELPATTLADGCYQGIFANCTSLTTTPTLPATTLAARCYYQMFHNCRSLTTAPELPVTTLAERCYTYMFSGCIALKTAPELPATTLATFCYDNMFSGCMSLTTAPTLHATILVECCYSLMFYGCYRINYIKMLATDISANSCLDDWASGVASTGTFVKKAGVSIPTGSSGIPSGWTVQEV